jgi:hypothetical protein
MTAAIEEDSGQTDDFDDFLKRLQIEFGKSLVSQMCYIYSREYIVSILCTFININIHLDSKHCDHIDGLCVSRWPILNGRRSTMPTWPSNCYLICNIKHRILHKSVWNQKYIDWLMFIFNFNYRFNRKVGLFSLWKCADKIRFFVFCQ